MGPRLGFVAALAAFSIVLASCTGGDGSDGGGTAGDSGQSGADEATSSGGDGTSGSNANASDTDDGEDDDDSGNVNTSPLNQYLGLDFDEEFDVERIEAEREVQDAIAACMRAQGFEYLQRDPTDLEFNDRGFGHRVDADGRREGSVEWAAKYGFGFSTLAFPQSQVGPALVGYDQEEREVNLNPNADYVANLSPEERTAYRAALSGTEEDYENTDFADRPYGLGCSGEARQEHGLDLQERQISVFEEFGDDLSEIADLSATHPTVLAVEREVSECIAKSGFEWIDSQTAGSSIKVSLGPVYEAANSLGRTDEEVAAGAPYKEFPDEIKDQLAEVQRAEIAHAMAIFECGGGATGRYNDVFTAVRNEMQQEYIDDNRDRLDAFILAQG